VGVAQDLICCACKVNLYLLKCLLLPLHFGFWVFIGLNLLSLLEFSGVWAIWLKVFLSVEELLVEKTSCNFHRTDVLSDRGCTPKVRFSVESLQHLLWVNHVVCLVNF
jgi:hypothetical protein